AAIEGRLTTEEHQRLEALVLGDAEARRLYVEYLHQHASLRWSVAEPSFLPLASTAPALARAPAVGPAPARIAGRIPWRRAAGLVAAAAMVVMGIGLGLRWALKHERAPAPFARLAEGKACKWDGGTLPTEVGARLGSGRLRLAEGLARILFDSGA